MKNFQTYQRGSFDGATTGDIDAVTDAMKPEFFNRGVVQRHDSIRAENCLAQLLLESRGQLKDYYNYV